MCSQWSLYGPNELELTAFLSGSIQFTKRSCEALGITFELRCVGQAVDNSVTAGEGVEEAIVAANDEEEVGGVMVSPVHQSGARGRGGGEGM